MLTKRRGPPELLVLEDIPSPQPGSGQVLVSVHASAINFPDSLIIEDRYLFKPAQRFSPGGEVAGVVRSVIACASTEEKLALCRSLGAEETINYSTQDLRERIRALTGGRGVDVVYDPVGGAFAESALRSMAWNGRYLVIGFTSGKIPRPPLNWHCLRAAQSWGCSMAASRRRSPTATKL